MVRILQMLFLGVSSNGRVFLCPLLLLRYLLLLVVILEIHTISATDVFIDHERRRPTTIRHRHPLDHKPCRLDIIRTVFS